MRKSLDGHRSQEPWRDLRAVAIASSAPRKLQEDHGKLAIPEEQAAVEHAYIIAARQVLDLCGVPGFDLQRRFWLREQEPSSHCAGQE